MKSRNARLLSAAMVSAISLLAASAAQAQVHPEKPTYKFEKCYGVAKAGLNDCFTATHSCAGTAKSDAERDTWVYVPQGTCMKLVGGTLTPPKS